MSDGYRVVDADGREHGPMNGMALARMYAEGRIDGDSYVYEPKNRQWRRLREVVDLAKIERLRERLGGEPRFVQTEGRGSLKTAVKDENRSEAISSSFIPHPSSLPYQAPSAPTPTISGMVVPGMYEPRTRGMVAAAILLLINVALNALGLAALVSEGVPGSGSVLIVFTLFDLAAALGLLRGKHAWRKWTIIRALLGAILFGVIRPLSTPITAVIISGLYQIIFSAIIIALLYRKPAGQGSGARDQGSGVGDQPLF
ncbi:MAG: GYF domain-containing protein [Blastocatellia bacterium]|nr:GYF domain-containing protein [Blastocatellia bacterium]